MKLIKAFVLLQILYPAALLAQVTLIGSPDPFPPDQNGLGQITLTWSAPGSSLIEIRIGSPSGPLFLRGSSEGSAMTGQWTRNGMVFLLQDVSRGEPGTTIGTYTAHSVPPELPNENLLIPTADGQKLIYSAPEATLLEVHVNSPSGPLLSRSGESAGLISLASWVQNGQTFYLQDVSNGHPLNYHYTRAATVVRPNPNAKPGVVFGATSDLLLDPQDANTNIATLYWFAPSSQSIQIRLHAPNGHLFAEGANSGSATTGNWIFDATTIYLQDATTGDPTSSDNTLATAVISFQRPIEHFALPLSKTGPLSVYDRESARFLNFLPLPTLNYTATPDGAQLVAIGDQSVSVVDPSSANVTSTIDLSGVLPIGSSINDFHSLPFHVWIKGPENEDWLLLGTDNSGLPSIYIVDPGMGKIIGSFPKDGASNFIFNPYNKLVYFFRGASLIAMDSSLKQQTVRTGFTFTPNAVAAVRLGASSALLLQDDELTGTFPNNLTYKNRTFLFSLINNDLTDISAEVPLLNTGQASVSFLPSFDGNGVYAQPEILANQCQAGYPCIGPYFLDIERYDIRSSTPFLQHGNTLPVVDETRLAGLDERYLYLWTNYFTLTCGTPQGCTPNPTTSVVTKVDPNSLAPIANTLPIPGGLSRYDEGQQPSVITGHYALDLPTCGQWYCEVKP